MERGAALVGATGSRKVIGGAFGAVGLPIIVRVASGFASKGEGTIGGVAGGGGEATERERAPELEVIAVEPSLRRRSCSNARHVGYSRFRAMTSASVLFACSERFGTATYACEASDAAAGQLRPAERRYIRRANCARISSALSGLVNISAVIVELASTVPAASDKSGASRAERNLGKSFG